MNNFAFNLKKTMDLSVEEIVASAELFSSSYGIYSEQSTRRPGQRVHMSASFFEKKYKKEDIYIATCRHRNILIGQAIYVRKMIPEKGYFTWVMQLVVAEKYRQKGIGSRLLYSIWGFSNDFAWGLATKNPCTVRALEAATFRKCDPRIIQENLDIVKQVSDNLNFVIDDKYEVNDHNSMAYTDFDVDDTAFKDGIGNDWKLGSLKPGYEWLAFTFQNQAVDQNLFTKHFEEMVSFSEIKLKEAYGRMKMSEHPWARHQKEEMDYILKMCSLKEGSVLDAGCGSGRHSFELANRKFDVLGIDFSSKNIKRCKNKLYGLDNKKQLLLAFETCDIRKFSPDKRFDLVLALYDVIGSFPDREDNQNIVQSLARVTKKGGYLAISVMNLELTDKIAKYKGNMEINNSLLYSLKPANIMQKNGNIFDNDHFVLDEEKGIVYRKEQFLGDDELFAEYLIRDKRYTLSEIGKLVADAGFEIIDSRYVQAGRFDVSLDALDDMAKEILIIAKKY